MVKHMVLFMCTRIIIPESKTKCLEIVIESKNDDLLTKVPIGLEISEDAPCCGDSWCTEILVEIAVPPTVEQQMETKQCKFYAVGRRVFPPKRYVRKTESISMRGFVIFKLQRTHHHLNITSQDDEVADSLPPVQWGIIGVPYKEKYYILCCILLIIGVLFLNNPVFWEHIKKMIGKYIYHY